MTTTYTYTREVLDRMVVDIGESKIRLGCIMHPTAGVEVFYQDGNLRLLCRECGFEGARVRVARAEVGR